MEDPAPYISWIQSQTEPRSESRAKRMSIIVWFGLS
jgi:hypothetical protein